MNAFTVYKPLQALKESIEVKTITLFLAITFILTWGVFGLLIIFYDKMISIFGEMSMTNPLFILAVYSPGIAGVFLVWRHYGLKGLGNFFKRLTLWQAPIPWWLFLVLGIPVLFYAGAAMKGSIHDPFPFTPWYQVIPIMMINLFIGPIEEFGWRGLALPLLQRKLAPFWAGLIIGIIWAVWHIPAFLLSGTPQSAWAFGPFFIGVVALSVILTPLFNAAKGSLLIAYLYHFQMNNPLWPDAQPYDILFFTIAAIIIVGLNHKKMFQCEGGVTDVLMAED